MAERAHPEDAGFKDHFFGFTKNKYKRRLYERYRFCNEYLDGKVVLDIPCGSGWGTSLLKKTKALIGIDRSAESVGYAADNFRNKICFFLAGDMTSIPLRNNSVEVVICLEGFEHISRENGRLFIDEAKRVLKIGGLLIMTCPVLNECRQSTGNPYHLVEYEEHYLIQILNSNFRILSLDRVQGPDGPEYRAVVSNFKSDRYEVA